MVMAQEFLQGPHLAKLVEAERITIAAGVPTVLDDVLRSAVADGRDMSALRLLVCGGAAVPPSLIERWAAAGVELLQGWGMTETRPLCALRGRRVKRRKRRRWPGAPARAGRSTASS